jgi:hypothetical protein
MYLDRSGKMQTIAYRMPKPEKKGKGASAGSSDEAGGVVAKPRPDVTRKGHDMIGDIRTDALHDAFARAPISLFERQSVPGLPRVCCGLNRRRPASRASRKRSSPAVSSWPGRVLRRPSAPLVRNPTMLTLAVAAP